MSATSSKQHNKLDSEYMTKQIRQLWGTKRSLALGLSLVGLLALGAMQAQAIHLGNFVWYDANGNGIQDPGEPGINGVAVELRLCATGELLSTTITADGPDGAAGYYQFGAPTYYMDVNVGYYVKFILPTGYLFTTQYAGTDIALDSNANPTTGESDCITFTDWNEDQTFDCGLVAAIGTGTPGYWANHPEAWPVASIVIGGVTYTKEQAISFMLNPVKKDKWLTMFPALVSAELNVLIGAQSSCIATTITQADAWMASATLKRPVAGSGRLWREGDPLYQMLDAYNNGLLCAPHRN
jgi:hypothetical protein